MIRELHLLFWSWLADIGLSLLLAADRRGALSFREEDALRLLKRGWISQQDFEGMKRAGMLR